MGVYGVRVQGIGVPFFGKLPLAGRVVSRAWRNGSRK